MYFQLNFNFHNNYYNFIFDSNNTDKRVMHLCLLVYSHISVKASEHKHARPTFALTKHTLCIPTRFINVLKYLHYVLN